MKILTEKQGFATTIHIETTFLDRVSVFSCPRFGSLELLPPTIMHDKLPEHSSIKRVKEFSKALNKASKILSKFQKKGGAR